MVLFPGNIAQCYPENKPGAFDYRKDKEFIGGVWMTYQDYANIMDYIYKLQNYKSEFSGLK